METCSRLAAVFVFLKKKAIGNFFLLFNWLHTCSGVYVHPIILLAIFSTFEWKLLIMIVMHWTIQISATTIKLVSF
jgi:hypothetical protein